VSESTIAHRMACAEVRFDAGRTTGRERTRHCEADNTQDIVAGIGKPRFGHEAGAGATAAIEALLGGAAWGTRKKCVGCLRKDARGFPASFERQ